MRFSEDTGDMGIPPPDTDAGGITPEGDTTGTEGQDQPPAGGGVD